MIKLRKILLIFLTGISFFGFLKSISSEPSYSCLNALFDQAPFIRRETSTDYATGQVKYSTQALGPIFETSLSGQEGYAAFRPFSIQFNEYGRLPKTDNYFLYPFAHSTRSPTYSADCFFFNLLSMKHYYSAEGCTYSSDFTLFPFIFFHDSVNCDTSYRGIFPLGGTIRGIFGLPRFDWLLFPLYARFDHGSYTRGAFLWPFIQWQEGPNSHGFGVWPLFGHFHKNDQFLYEYRLWPLIYRRIDGIGTDDPVVQEGVLPFYARKYSKNLDSLTVLFPFFGYTIQKDPWYYEQRQLWPFIVHAHGENGDYIHRTAPFYTESYKNGLFKVWYMWPLINIRSWKQDDLQISQASFLYFLYLKQVQRSEKDPSFKAQKEHLWPLYSYWDNGQGCKQIQFFSLLEPLFQNNKVIRHLYSPLFAIYRFNQTPDQYEHQFLFNFINQRVTPDSTHFHIGGLLNYDCCSNSSELELLGGLIRLKENCEEGRSLHFFDFQYSPSNCHSKRLPPHSISLL